MTLSFQSELAEVFSPDEFGQAAVIVGFGSVNGVIVRTPAQPFEGAVTENAPFFRCRESDVSGIREGNFLTVDGADWTVAWVDKEDRTLTVRLHLSERP